ENIDVLKDVGYIIAPIPEQFGGVGVESVYDVLVASSRLARGDASTTIGLYMHLLVVLNMVHRWRTAVSRGDDRRAAAFATPLERIVDAGVVIAAAVSNSISFSDVHLPESAVRGGFPVGDTAGYIQRNLANGLFHAAAS